MEATSYRFKLASAQVGKRACPACGKRRHWQRYVDTETGEPLPEQYGRCDNASKCGHSLNPYSDGYVKAFMQQERGMMAALPVLRRKPRPRPPQEPVLTPLPIEVLLDTLKGYEVNTFIQNLLCNVPFPFDATDVQQVLDMYYLGTVTEGFRAGAVTFPFIDVQDNLRAVQVKLFNAHNHTVDTGFLHTMLERSFKDAGQPLPDWLTAYLRNDGKVTCLFGEHLLNRFPMQPIALVEAPKTAIYGTLYFGMPQEPDGLLWLAVYNLSSLSLKKCKALAGRDVYLFPDLSTEARAYNLWKQRAIEMQRAMPQTRFKVSDLLERHASPEQREQGCDLADFLISQDWRLFRRNASNDERACAASEESEESERSKELFFSEAMPQQSARPPMHPDPVEVTEATSCTFTDIVDTMPIPMDWERLEQPEPWELDPF